MALIDRGARREMKKRKHRKKKTSNVAVQGAHGAIDQPSAIDLADALEKRCTQAAAIAGLLMETDAEAEVADTAWVLRDLIEEIRVIGRSIRCR
jgi:hypothetical protein